MVKSIIDLTVDQFEIFHNMYLKTATCKSLHIPTLLRFSNYKLTVGFVFLISKLLSTPFFFKLPYSKIEKLSWLGLLSNPMN